MATGTVLDSTALRAIKIAREQGQKGLEDIVLPPDEDSDGEDYGLDEDPNPHWAEEPAPKDEPWPTFLLRCTIKTGFAALAVVDYTGEWLAEFFGITTPRYQYVIDEIVRAHDEEQAELEEERRQIEEANAKRDEEANRLEAATEVGEPDCPAVLEVDEEGDNQESFV